MHCPLVDRAVSRIDPGLHAEFKKVIRAEGPWPIFLHGAAGTGKSCAALALLDHVQGGGQYYTVSKLCSDLISAQQGRLSWSREGHGGTVFPDDFWRKISATTILVLDELGCRGSVSDAHFETVKEAIDLRANKPLIVISNHGPEKIGQLYDDRIFSRLMAGTVIQLSGDDQRLRN